VTVLQTAEEFVGDAVRLCRGRAVHNHMPHDIQAAQKVTRVVGRSSRSM
jgi:hypothetical protein